MSSKGKVLLTLFFVATMILSVAPIAVASASLVMEIPPNLKRIELILSFNEELWASQVLASSLDPESDSYYELLNLKWDVPDGGVSYVINPTGAPDDSEFEVEAAFEAWDAEVSIELYANDPEIDDGAKPSKRRPDYENVVSWGRIRSAGVVAMASIWYNTETLIDGNYLIVDADITFNTLQPWGIDPDGEGSEFTLLNAFDVRNVGTHEVGHLCGLGDIYDSSHSELTMYGYTDFGEVNKISLGQGDSLGVQEMYDTIPPDTIPPAQVTGLTVTTMSSSRLDLTWTDNLDLDLDYYNVYRSITSGDSYDLVASLITNGYSDTGLTASTIYYYVVMAVDTSGNEGEASSEESGTTSEGSEVTTMHVANIEMSTGSRTAGRNTFGWAIAKVTIVDDDGALEGATVYGHWEGATSDSDSGTTDANGQVLLQSDSVKNPEEKTFTFVVENVVLNGWDYDSSENVETSDSIIF